MPPLTPKQEKLIKAAQAGMSDKEYIQFEQLQEINDTLTEIRDKDVTVSIKIV